MYGLQPVSYDFALISESYSTNKHHTSLLRQFSSLVILHILSPVPVFLDQRGHSRRKLRFRLSICLNQNTTSVVGRLWKPVYLIKTDSSKLADFPKNP